MIFCFFLVFQNIFVASQLFTAQVQSSSFIIKVVENKQMQTQKCKEVAKTFYEINQKIDLIKDLYFLNVFFP